MTKLLTAICLMLAASLAQAQTNYAGVGITHFDIDDEIGLTAITATYDFKATDNFSFQLGVATGGDDDLQLPPPIPDIKVELKYALTAKAKAGLMTGNAFLYGMLGYAKAELEASTALSSFTEDGSGSLLGVGVDFLATETWGFGLE
jgi:hypothetical protein